LQGVAGEERVEERGWAYRRRQPEGTVLYEAVKDNLATLLAEASEVGRCLPRYVERDVSPVPGLTSVSDCDCLTESTLSGTSAVGLGRMPSQ
jgi:hypothetical protein